jgi:metal-responsive CopG/Arc/MetJ family transcriptional regulator
MPRKGYKSLSLPETIYEDLREITSREGSSYVSISELAKDALRDKIERIRSQNENWRHSGGERINE